MTGSNIISAIQHARRAKDFFEDFIRQHPGTKGAGLFKNYISKLDFIYRDLITTPALPPIVVEGIKKEWASDVYAVDAIMEKIPLLKPDQREAIEMVIDKILNGESINVEVSA